MPEFAQGVNRNDPTDKALLEVNCCIEHEGRKFCSNGAFISTKHITAYLSSDGKKITSWEGSLILSTEFVRLSERYTNYGKGFYLRFAYNDKIYSGFCLGEGAVIHARLTKLKHLRSA